MSDVSPPVSGIKWLLAVCFTCALTAGSAELPLKTPASFVGTLPCADCPGMDWHLDLWPDGRFQLQWRYQERDGRNDDLGRWRVNPADGSLLLFGGREAPTRLSVEEGGTLRLLQPDGLPIESSLPYSLERLADFTPAEIALPMAGEFRYLADAATFQECRSGYRYPVLMEGDYAGVEKRYLEERGNSEAAPTMFLQVDGMILNRQVMAGEGPKQSLRIERAVSVTPGMRCERAMANASLPNTYWRLNKLRGAEAKTPPGTREAHLVLHDARGSVAGFSGCNRFSGQYSVSGDRLAFGPLASTRMACPQTQSTGERAFLDALGQVARWRILAQTLELFDVDGKSLAVFDAVYLP